MRTSASNYALLLCGLALSCGPVQAATERTSDELPAAAPSIAVEDDAPRRVDEGAAEPVTLRVDVSGLRNREGDLLGVVFADERGFPRDFSRATKRVTLSASSDQVSFEVPPGRYAVVLVHDENKNGALDKNFIGMPREGIGLSNFEFKGTRPQRPPRWRDAAVGVEGDTAISIKLTYF